MARVMARAMASLVLIPFKTFRKGAWGLAFSQWLGVEFQEYNLSHNKYVNLRMDGGKIIKYKIINKKNKKYFFPEWRIEGVLRSSLCKTGLFWYLLGGCPSCIVYAPNRKRIKPLKSGLDCHIIKVWIFHKFLLGTNRESGVASKRRR